MACTTSYYDPTKGTFVRTDTDGGDMSKKQQARMALSGPGFMAAVRKQLWAGMGCTSAVRAAWIDTTPYFTDGPEAIMSGGNGRQEPIEMWIMPIALNLGVQGMSTEYINENICKFIKFNLKRKMFELAKKTVFAVAGLQTEAVVAPVTTKRPTYNVEEFKCIFPSGPKHLPLRATWLKDLEEMITAPSVQQEMEVAPQTKTIRW